MEPQDVDALIALEESLWRPATRFDADFMARVLADDFEEFGASGRHWSREESIGMPAERFEAVLDGVRVRALGPDAALVTYRSAVRGAGGERTAHRCSVWQRDGEAWRLRFHQGTPTG